MASPGLVTSVIWSGLCSSVILEVEFPSVARFLNALVTLNNFNLAQLDVRFARRRLSVISTNLAEFWTSGRFVGRDSMALQTHQCSSIPASGHVRLFGTAENKLMPREPMSLFWSRPLGRRMSLSVSWRSKGVVSLSAFLSKFRMAPAYLSLNQGGKTKKAIGSRSSSLP